MRNFSSAQGRVTLKWIIQSGWNLNSSEILYPSWIPASLEKIQSKMTVNKCRQHFPIISQWELLVTMTTTVLIQSDPKPYAAFPAPQWCYTKKTDQDWPTGLRDIKVQKCGQRQTDGGPLVYYKLTLWAFGLGEPKTGIFITIGSTLVIYCNTTFWRLKITQTSTKVKSN